MIFCDPQQDYYILKSGNYQDKSIGRMAGETMGMLANFNPAGIVKSSVRQATKMSLPIALKAFNWIRAAANIRVMKNMVHVGKVATAGENVTNISHKINLISKSLQAEQCIVTTSRISLTAVKNSLIAQKIAGGHAFEKHILYQGEFRWIRTKKQFIKHVQNVLNIPTDLAP